jgi:hypothetical protein
MHEIKETQARMESLGVKNYHPPMEEGEQRFKDLFSEKLL